MRICVPIKRTIDYRVKVQVKPDGTGVDTRHVKQGINPFDAIALEAALRLKEQGQGGPDCMVSVVSIGDASVQPCLREALAMGADQVDWLRVDAETATHLQPLAVARCLHHWVVHTQADLILMGKQAIDDDCNQTGQMLAGILGWPQATFASAINIYPSPPSWRAEVVREVDAGLETLRFSLPALITADLRLGVPRYPNLAAIMRTKRTPIAAHDVSKWGLSLVPQLSVDRVTPAPQRARGKQVTSLSDLLHALRASGVLGEKLSGK